VKTVTEALARFIFDHIGDKFIHMGLSKAIKSYPCYKDQCYKDQCYKDQCYKDQFFYRIDTNRRWHIEIHGDSVKFVTGEDTIGIIKFDQFNPKFDPNDLLKSVRDNIAKLNRRNKMQVRPW